MIARCLILFLFCSVSHAALKSSGSIEAYFKKYSFAPSEKYSDQGGGFNLDLKTDWKLNRQWRLRSELESWSDLASKDSSENFQGNPRNFYLENKSTSVTIRAGYQTVHPDGPDIVNPADVVHSKNWMDPTDPRTLSSAGLSFSQEFSEWQWELFFVPTQTKPILPGDRSPWWPREKRLPIESENVEFQIPKNVDYKITDSIELDQALKNNVMFRLQRKSEAFEAQALYYDGLSQDPFLLLDVLGTLISDDGTKTVIGIDSPVKLRPFYFRRQVVAGTFLVPIQNFVIKGGANWSQPTGSDYRLPKASSTAVLGIEKNFETRRGMVTMILQHEEQKKMDKSQVSFMRSLFENSWSLGARIPWGEEVQFLAGVIYDTIGRSSIYRLSATRRLSDAWTIGLEAAALEGPPESLLGLYNSYDSVGLNLTYHF